MVAWVLIIGTIFILLIVVAAYPRRSSPGNHFLTELEEEPEERGSTTARRVPQHRSVRSLSPEDMRGFLRVWRSVREHFPDDPKTAVLYADLLMSDVIGYPAWRNESGADMCLDGELKDKYRAAHKIAVRSRSGEMTREELARAISLYAAILNGLLGDAAGGALEPRPRGQHHSSGREAA